MIYGMYQSKQKRVPLLNSSTTKPSFINKELLKQKEVYGCNELQYTYNHLDVISYPYI